MQTVEKSIVINAPVEKVFEYIDNPLNNPEWLIGMMDVGDVVGEPGVGRHFEWTFKMVGIPLKGQSKTMEHTFNSRIVTESEGGITSTWATDLEPEGDGTRLKIKVDYTVPIPVLGKLAEHLIAKQNERNLESSLENIKQMLEA